MSTPSGSVAPNEGCRPATADDLPRLVELAAQARDELRQNKGGAVWASADARQPPFDERLGQELADPSVLVLVGTIDEAVIGYAVGAVRELPGGGRIGVLTDVYVEPEGREVGVGDRLLEDVLAWCGAQGCIGVDSLALPGDRHTKNFFEAHGLVARAIVVHRSLT
jgi:GNAT superfamily N-acetyltransferase